mgnify:CR=1 FL=1
MSKELLLVVDAVASEKGVPESVILEAIEAALATAAKKRYADEETSIELLCSKAGAGSLAVNGRPIVANGTKARQSPATTTVS